MVGGTGYVYGVHVRRGYCGNLARETLGADGGRLSVGVVYCGANKNYVCNVSC